MGLVQKLKQFLRSSRKCAPRGDGGPHVCRFETMEPRYVLSAVPLPLIELGAVYTELTTTGNETQGDRFEITWEGGAPGTQLTQLVISGDQDGNGFDDGDVFFDTVAGGPGAGAAFPFQIAADSDITAAQITGISVVDGGTDLVLNITGWDPGETLAFTIDVDEQDDTPNSLAEGAEFQNSHLTATFIDAQGHHQTVSGHGSFFDDYDQLIPSGLPLPLDSQLPSGEGTSVRTAGTGFVVEQPPLPFTISGTVYHDANMTNALDSGEVGIDGITVHLYHFNDQNGQYEDTGLADVTSGGGHYAFTHDHPGTYRVVEDQPAPYLSVGASPGPGASVTTVDVISDITLLGGEHHQPNNFAEVLPASISGRVHADIDGDCVLDPGEPTLGGVQMELLDANGHPTGIFTTTASDGTYSFTGLLPGTYGVREVSQPIGYFDADDHAGSAGGVVHNPGDSITGAILTSGLQATDYDFCEFLPASISGRVFVDTDGDCEHDPGETTLAGVTIELLDASGDPTGITTQTLSDGTYSFTGLAPGVYGVREVTQPAGYLDGEEQAGSAGGVAHNPGDSITGAVLTTGLQAADYDFCEHPAASISGYVYQDGPAILLPVGQSSIDPDLARAQRDGIHSPGDVPLSGVRLFLGDSDGSLLRDSLGNPISTLTDASGFYRFTGLEAGEYTVFEAQPGGFIDGIDSPGSGGGVAANYANESDPALSGISHHHDAIARITVAAGQEAVNNNFSEIAIRTQPPEIDIPPPEVTITPPRLVPFGVPSAIYIPPPAALVEPSAFEVFGGGIAPIAGSSWHLSIIDAGSPRGPSESADALVRVSLVNDIPTRDDLNQGRFTLADPQQPTPTEIMFGLPGAIPVSGDFDGDGASEVGVYYRGEFFLDLNGNGIWDEGDLWAKLGTERDQPVVGDWDGDGKIDIGIFGPEWPNDHRAVMAEPGLPDRDNVVTGAKKNPPPKEWEATSGFRIMRRASTGEARSDVIDHVFYYGGAGDIGVVGDWNGDGIATIGIFNDGTWILDDNGDGRWLPGETLIQFGSAGDLPVVGDWNGDGIDDVGVYRDGAWTLDTNGNRTLDGQDQVKHLGGAGDLPIVGDWDGDGIDDLGAYRDAQSGSTRVNFTDREARSALQ
ncbi:MAG: fibrinogen-binding protein [Planctomycetia bacterium]|nr:fibrinogen-binding protein [Planctomycetia bacterium]